LKWFLMSKTVICAVCRKEFEKKKPNRLRVLKKRVDRGEDTLWICPACSKKIKIGD